MCVVRISLHTRCNYYRVASPLYVFLLLLAVLVAVALQTSRHDLEQLHTTRLSNNSKIR